MTPHPPPAEETAEFDEATSTALTSYRQGDILEDMTVLYAVGEGGRAIPIEAPLGAVLISQTCDVVLPDRPGGSGGSQDSTHWCSGS